MIGVKFVYQGNRIKVKVTRAQKRVHGWRINLVAKSFIISFPFRFCY